MARKLTSQTPSVVEATSDFIVIGAGSAGSVMAARLSEDGHNTVTLLEAGGSDRHTLIAMPLTWMTASTMPRFTWGTKSDPEPFMDDRVLDLPRGRLMGGSGSIDGRMYICGQAADYDAWQAKGLVGWGYADVLPYFRRMETNWRGASDIHGGDGPINVIPMRPHKELRAAFAAATTRLGYALTDDFNGADNEGFGLPDVMVRNGRRHSPSRAYLDPAAGRRNLAIRSGMSVQRILIEEGRATGVVCDRGGVTQVLRARREIILCAGTFHSPHLLMLSGIGPGAELRDHGIAVHADRPAVGDNLQDHPVALTFWSASRPVTFERELRADRLAFNVARWMLTGRGTPSQSPLTFQGFLRSSPEQDRADLQFQASHVHFAARPWLPLVRKGAGHAISATSILLNPESRGRVSLASADPAALPAIRLNFLEAEGDRVRMRRSIRFIRALFGTAPLADYVAAELAPGAAADSDAALDAWLRASTISGAHGVGTCAMAAGEGGVVDAELRVKGVDGLRVVDCSVMPDIVRGNTAAPAMMIAEKASDMILGRSSPVR